MHILAGRLPRLVAVLLQAVVLLQTVVLQAVGPLDHVQIHIWVREETIQRSLTAQVTPEGLLGLVGIHHLIHGNLVQGPRDADPVLDHHQMSTTVADLPRTAATLLTTTLDDRRLVLEATFKQKKKKY